MNTIGERIRWFRKHRDVSQLELETQADITINSLSDIERGKKRPTLPTLEKIARTLKLSEQERSYLFGYTVDPPTEEEKQEAINAVHHLLTGDDFYGVLYDERATVIQVSDRYRALMKASECNSDYIGQFAGEYTSDTEGFLFNMMSPKKWFEYNSAAFGRLLIRQPHLIADELFMQAVNRANDRFPHHRAIFDDLQQNAKHGDPISHIELSVGRKLFVSDIHEQTLDHNSRFLLGFLAPYQGKLVNVAFPFLAKMARARRRKNTADIEHLEKKIGQILHLTDDDQ